MPCVWPCPPLSPRSSRSPERRAAIARKRAPAGFGVVRSWPPHQLPVDARSELDRVPLAVGIADQVVARYRELHLGHRPPAEARVERRVTGKPGGFERPHLARDQVELVPASEVERRAQPPAELGIVAEAGPAAQ